mmetsp:Transcript_58673/g.65650  ORF Transcript_58673/g.65650 Transcript_58673/m.65650 type:complete len:115 (+) Transcript_58673:193-537(+)
MELEKIEITPIIADAKKSLDKAQSDIEAGTTRVIVLNKMGTNLKQQKEKSMDESKEMIEIWIDAKRTYMIHGIGSRRRNRIHVNTNNHRRRSRHHRSNNHRIQKGETEQYEREK